FVCKLCLEPVLIVLLQYCYDSSLYQPHSLHLASHFFSKQPPPPRSTLFPYTTLFRSSAISPTTESPRPPAVSCSGHRSAAPCRCDRKSTRLNSSHVSISYSVFCLKTKDILRRKDNVRGFDHNDM